MLASQGATNPNQRPDGLWLCEGKQLRIKDPRIRRPRRKSRRGFLLAGLHSDEQCVPFMMFAGCGRSTARESLIEQLRPRDLFYVHPSPVGKWAATGTSDLICQHFDDAVVLAIVVRFNNPVPATVTELKQSGLRDGRSQYLINVRIGHWEVKA